MSEIPPSSSNIPNTPTSPEQMMALIVELHSDLTIQRTRIAKLTSQADLATSQVSTSSPFTPKKNKPPTFDGKSPPDSWVAHMTSYVHGLPDEHEFLSPSPTSPMMRTTGSLQIKLQLLRLATP
jgi:hypothetical protein